MQQQRVVAEYPPYPEGLGVAPWTVQLGKEDPSLKSEFYSIGIELVRPWRVELKG